MKRLVLMFPLAAMGCGGEVESHSSSPTADQTNVESAHSSGIVIAELPDYQILETIELAGGGGTFGDVMIASYKADIDVDTMEAVARAIVREEGYSEASFYNSETAWESNLSESFSRDHPGALESGFLGSYRNDQFTPTPYVHDERFRPSAPEDTSPQFEIVERKMLNDALILSVSTTAMEQIDSIVRTLIEPEKASLHGACVLLSTRTAARFRAAQTSD